jgi:hypothetical protein
MSYEPYGRDRAPVDHKEVLVYFNDLSEHFSYKKDLMRKWLNEHNIAYSIGFGQYCPSGAVQPYYIASKYAVLFKLTWA